ncbi:MAG: prepilin-type N-terminal cleavage/methylation domain-containing protein [Patescibacteria group bacterium]|nr:prepilin-type N-terminal cleavage/methylation domain-containing protein [Patescibacteria group bacterium]
MRKNNNTGFTLAELLIVITIILLFFPMVISNYNTSEKQFSLYRSAHNLAQDLRDTQEMAMTGQLTPLSFDQSFPRGGYGLYFKDLKNSYILFADCDGDNEYDSEGIAATCTDATVEDPYPEKLQDLSLEPGVLISNIIPQSPLVITFLPPTPLITINPQPFDNQAVISLTFSRNTKTVSINTVGLIDVD